MKLFSIVVWTSIAITCLSIPWTSIAQGESSVKRTLQAVDYLLNQYSNEVLSLHTGIEDTFYIYYNMMDARSLRTGATILHAEFGLVELRCNFCHYQTFSKMMSFPLNWQPEQFATQYPETYVKVTERDLSTKWVERFQHFISPLMKTDIKNHYALQFNSFSFDEKHFRLILLRKKGKRFKFVTHIYEQIVFN